MEEVETQVAAPLFIHQSRFREAGLVGTKRSICYNSINNHKHPHSQIELTRDGGWSPKDWEWDSARFVAKPRHPEADMLCLGVFPVDNREGGVFEPVLQDSTASRGSNSQDKGEKNGSDLRLQVGDAHVSSSKSNGGNFQSSDSAEETAPSSRPNKKVRSGSPGSGGNYPVCQVDDCMEDLSKAKDYHRRHKVCVPHSKATKTVVGKQIQRFCQQCSRFHPLSEFDEGKRSCRRRLAGHNRRRRKTQPQDTTSPIVHPTNSNDFSNGNLDIVNLLTILACQQGIAEKNVSNCSTLPDKNQLMEILSKINALPRAPLPSTGTTNPSGSNKNNSEQAALGRNNIELNPAAKPKRDVFKGSSSSYQSPTDDSDGQVQDPRTILPLQLFSPSPGVDSPPNMDSPQKYFSSDSCSPPDARSHSSFVPITRTLFPLETTSQIDKTDRMSLCQEANVNVEASRRENFASGMTLELFSLGNKAVSSTPHRLPHHAGYTSSSGSDHSPPSFNSDPQKDRTGRIMFKLFDKDPSQFPVGLRTQIYNWLSNSPSDMESFIRPGCVVLSIYASMPSAAWVKIEENFSRQVNSLVKGFEAEFWRNGRFSVNIGKQLAFHKDGKFNFCKPWSTPNSPELVVVSPLAVVSGQATSLVIRGRNLTSPGTKIHCAYMGGYSSKDVSGSTYQQFMFDEIRLIDFKVHAASSFLGRCFIEVENGLKGNSFPIIIADAKVCQELRLLEQEFDDKTQDVPSPGSHEEILCFLNELGWLFQRKSSSDVANHDFLPHRFQYLLTFSIERDYCALVKTLLDILVEKVSKTDRLSTECLEGVAKMNLLHRAVKKRSKRMVDLLIHYSVTDDNGVSKQYVFPPNLKGPGGITPLHLAACTSGSYDIVDSLTDDPLEIGLQSWKSLLDDNGQSPCAYATMRNDQSLNSLVDQKLIDRRNSQVSLSIENEVVESLELSDGIQRSSSLQFTKKLDSCSKCAKLTYSRMPGSHNILHRPFIHSVLAVAAVCVCVSLFFKSMSAPLIWDNFDCGSM